MKKFLSLVVSLIFLIQAPSINADRADTLNAEGQKLIDQGKFTEALEAYKKAIKLKPDFWSPYRNAGWVLEYKLNKPQDALPYYFKAIELNPTEPISFLEIAATYMD